MSNLEVVQVDGVGPIAVVRGAKPALTLEQVTAQRDAAVEALRQVKDLDPDVHSSEGFNEWGEADCFRQAQAIASAAIEGAA